MSTLLLIGLVAAAAGFIYWAYTTLVGNASVKDTVESLTVEKAVETLKTEAKKDLDLNKDGKVDLGDAVEGVKKAIENKPENPTMLKELKIFLEDMDKRKRTNWRVTFPWLVPVIDHL